MLGIDAAWTAAQPSGVAVAAERDGRWTLIAAEPSYRHFLARADGVALTERPRGDLPDAPALITAAKRLAGGVPALVAIDMPLAHQPIAARRAADNAVTSAYGARKCGTHSPSSQRPGPISDGLRQDFAALGYPLLTQDIDPPGLIEVYPHPALVEWSGATKRLPYKRGNTSRYWPGMSRGERLARLQAVWADIIALLDRRIAGTATLLGSPASTKAEEDRLDAVICCAVAIDALAGRARPYGDADAAIWCPLS